MEQIKQKKCEHDFDVKTKKSKSESGNMDIEYLNAICKKCGFSQQHFLRAVRGQQTPIK